MLRKSFLIFLVLFSLSLFSQVEKGSVTGSGVTPEANDSLPRRKVTKVKTANKPADTIATIDMYQIVTLQRDTTFIDTSLTVQKEYRVNYLRKDNFGLLPFSNEGQTYNILDYGLTQFNPYPEFGFTAKHAAYMGVNDINYYHVATPYTDLLYRSVLGQGQLLDAFITMNTSQNLTFLLAIRVYGP